MKSIALLALICLLPAAAQQTNAAQQPAAAPQPKFEVADVHNSTTNRAYAQSVGGRVYDGIYVNRSATMMNLLTEAYGVPQDSVAGGPPWMTYDLFDIVAKVPPGTSDADAKLMLQSLLAERFGLVVRHDTAPVPRYVLSVDKGGPKLTKAAPADDSGCKPIMPPQSGSQPPPPPAPVVDLAATPNFKLGCHNLTSADIALNLHQWSLGYLDHDVLDQTKLDGAWDFQLEFTPITAVQSKGTEGISIFTAVDKQLGLKLELQQVPLPALSVIAVNRKPTVNPDGIAATLAGSAARFEVASIKPQDPAHPFTGFKYAGGSQFQVSGTLRQLLGFALEITPNVANDLLVGLPKSADTQRWDILAKLPATGEGALTTVAGHPVPPSAGVVFEMLRGVLLDQFELKYHTEPREVPVYVLTVANGKPKITRAGDTEREVCVTDYTTVHPYANMGNMAKCTNTSMAELAEHEQMNGGGGYIDHPVVDETGLTGAWDFELGWTPKSLLLPSASPADAGQQGGQATDPRGTASIFEALPRDLGLKLEVEKRTIPVIAIDHVNEQPVE